MLGQGVMLDRSGIDYTYMGYLVCNLAGRGACGKACCGWIASAPGNILWAQKAAAQTVRPYQASNAV